ncbi:hypothetical protein V8G54_008085 [Vigna mungo]|uniref:J domain-containing protein n=1 Tax=Vigna mungo TaxID=3915 RepID=A0AAQ3S8W5_VIGMU
MPLVILVDQEEQAQLDNFPDLTKNPQNGEFTKGGRDCSICIGSSGRDFEVVNQSESFEERHALGEGMTAFRTKAKEYHPDQNQDNIEAAEAKFKEVLTSYEAIKKERRN